MSIEYLEKCSVRTSTDTSDYLPVDLILNSTKNILGVLTVPSAIQLYDATTLKQLSNLSSTSYNFNEDQTIKINQIKFAQHSQDLLLASTNKNVVLIFDVRVPHQEIFQLNGCLDEHDFLSVASNNCDQLVAAGSSLKNEDNVVIAFWDLRSTTKTDLLGFYTDSHSDEILQLSFHRLKSNILLSGSVDGLVCCFDLTESNESDALQQVYNANGSVDKCGFLYDTDNKSDYTVYAITSSNTFYIWSSNDNVLIAEGDTICNESLSMTDSINSLELDVGDDKFDIDHHPESTSLKVHKQIHHISCHCFVDFLKEIDSEFFLSFPLTSSLVVDSLNNASLKVFCLITCDNIGNMKAHILSNNDDSTQTFASVHSDIIRSVVYSRGLLYSCSEDGSIVLWKLSTNNMSNQKTTTRLSTINDDKLKRKKTKNPY